MSAMIDSSAARRPSYSFCTVSDWSAASTLRHRSSSSLTVIARSPTRAAMSDGLCAGADEHATSIPTVARNTARVMKLIIRINVQRPSSRTSQSGLGNCTFVVLLASCPAEAKADVDEPRCSNRRRLQLHPVLLVEHVLHGDEQIHRPVDFTRGRQVHHAVTRHARFLTRLRLDVQVVVEL